MFHSFGPWARFSARLLPPQNCPEPGANVIKLFSSSSLMLQTSVYPIPIFACMSTIKVYPQTQAQTWWNTIGLYYKYITITMTIISRDACTINVL
jgi:hypothetical protein